MFSVTQFVPFSCSTSHPFYSRRLAFLANLIFNLGQKEKKSKLILSIETGKERISLKHGDDIRKFALAFQKPRKNFELALFKIPR